jgi:quinol---cytochrome c reductase iron-sulfur subunit
MNVRRAEMLVLALLCLTAAGAIAFVAVYFVGADTQLLGLTIGLAFAFAAAAAVIAGKAIVPLEIAVEERPRLAEPEQQEQVMEALEKPVEGITRKRLLTTAAGGAGVALAGAVVIPLVSLGPDADVQLGKSPWRRGRLLVDVDDAPILADEIGVGSFRTGFPQGADKEALASPVVVVRVEPAQLRLPAERSGWAPDGIMAYSKICTHAACAISLFRYPLYAPNSPGPALVCPCHYSTFDVLRGGDRIFGPAGRPLPQLPLLIDDRGQLVAGGDFSGRPGPSWWSVRK